MKGLFYGVLLQWKMDLRSKTMLIACYLVPLAFFALMGGIFVSIMPESRQTLIQTMTVFAISMGALIGLPPTLVEFYGSDIRKVYQVSGIPGWVGFVLALLSAFCHLLLMSVLLLGLSFVCFGGEIPQNLQEYVLALILLLLASLLMAGVVGLGVKDQAKTSLFSILLFLPSILLSGVFFPTQLLSPVLEGVGKCFPAFWGSRLLTQGLCWENIWPLMGLLILYGMVDFWLLRGKS